MRNTISLIIPSYNTKEHLVNTYESVRRYYKDVEMVIINDGSLDDTSKIGMSMASYGQGAPGTIVKNVFGYSAELDVWGPPPSTSQGSKMLAITPVVINSQERISVFNIGNGQKLYANVVSNQIRMCDEEQYCTIQKSSQSIAGLSINILGTLQLNVVHHLVEEMMKRHLYRQEN